MAVGVSAFSTAQSFTEGFENITTLTGSGWTSINASVLPSTAGPLGSHWWQGNANALVPSSGNLTAPSGTASSFISSDFGASTSSAAATLSNWLFAPERVLSNGDTFSFFARASIFGGNTVFPDRLRLMLSTSGASTTFSNFTPVLTINQNLTTTGFPTTWTQFSFTVTGLSAPTAGRFAFHYDVTNGGLNGANSGKFGIDSVEYVGAVPEPATITALAFGSLVALRRRRKS